MYLTRKREAEEYITKTGIEKIAVMLDQLNVRSGRVGQSLSGMKLRRKLHTGSLIFNSI